MVFKFFIIRLKSLILIIVRIFRKAMCCFERRRRNSTDCEPLTDINILSDNFDNPNQFSHSDLNDWGQPWQVKNENNKNTSIQQQIEMYRERTRAANQNLNEQPIDQDLEHLFDDLAPKITGQKKVYINTNKNDSNKTNNSLSYDQQNLELIYNSQLGEWEENTGWEAEQNLDANEFLRESRRLERERRAYEQQQKRLEKLSKQNTLGFKIHSK